MKRLFVTFALAGLLAVGLGPASNALTFTVTQPSATTPGGAADNFYIFPYSAAFPGGVNSDAGLFTAQLIPSSPVPPTVQNFANDSSVSFGNTAQVINSTGSDTYTNVAANYTFDLTVPIAGTTKQFQVQGLINGSTSFNGTLGTTNAMFAPKTILVDGVVTPFVVATSPAGRVSDTIFGIDFGNNNLVNVYIDQLDALTPPVGPGGVVNVLSVGGFVQSAVPEPGVSTMLMGLGVFGGFLGLRLRRRR